MGVDSEDVLSVALDSFADGIGSYQFEAVNFMSGDKPFASNTSVRWEIASLTSNGASITQDGLLTFTKPGEIVVKATSQENAEVSAIYTVRVGGVTETDVFWDYPSQNTQIAFDESNNSKTLAVQVSGTSLTATFTINALVQPSDITSVDKSFTIEVVSGDGVEINGNQVTFTNGGSVQLKLVFDYYTDVVRYININVITSVFDYDPAAEFYRFGTENQVPIRLVDGLNLEGVSFVGEPLAGENYQAQVVIDAEVDSVTGETIYLMEFSGGGKITIYAKAGETVLDSFVVQVIYDAVNVSKENQFVTNKTMCLVNDIVKGNGGIAVGKGCYLYGNGYTITATSESYTSKTGGFVSLAGTLDNVKIVGLPVDNFYFSSNIEDSDKASYYKSSSTIQISTSGAEIHNSYIANGKFTVRLYQPKTTGGETAATVTISNSILDGGIACIAFDGVTVSTQLNLNSVKLVQQPRVVNEKEIVGVGLLSTNSKMEMIDVNFTGETALQCFVNLEMISDLPAEYKEILADLWSNSEFDDYKFTYNNVVYMHMPIVVRVDGENYPSINTDSNSTLSYQTQSGEVKSRLLGKAVSATVKDPQTGISGKVDCYVAGFDQNSLVYVNENIGNWITTKPQHVWGYQPIEPDVTIANELTRIELPEGVETVDISSAISSNFSAVKYGYSAPFTTDEHAKLPLYYTVNVYDSANQLVPNWTSLAVGSYKVVYTLVDKFENGIEYSYTTTIAVDRPASLTIQIGRGTETFNQTKFNNSVGAIVNKGLNGISDGTIQYFKEATYYSETWHKEYDDAWRATGDVNPIYYINTKEFFDIGVYYTSDANGISNKDVTAELSNVVVYCRTTPGEFSESDTTISFNTEVSLPGSNENNPSSRPENTARYVQIYYFKICATYGNIETEREVAVAFYVEELAIWGWW